MYRGLLLLAILLTLGSSEVLKLDKNNFDQAVKDHPMLLVKFYIDGCQYCEKMQPVFEQLARRLEEYDFVLGEVNAYENKVLTAKQKVKGYPTLILYKNGKPNGFPQSTDSVLYLFEYALQHAYGLVTYMTTQKEIDLFIKRSNIAVVCYTTVDISGQAVNNLPVKYGQVYNPEFRTQAGHDYVIYNKALEKPLFYDGDIQGLNIFINEHAYPAWFTFTEEEFKKAEKDKLPLLAIYTTESDIVFRRLRYISESFAGKLRLVLIDPRAELAIRRFEYQIGNERLEVSTIYIYSYSSKQLLKTKIDKDDVADLKEYVNQLYSQLKPEEKPKINQGEVLVLTKDNWNQLVDQSDKHFLVKFYAPWCGHCKHLAPIYEQLAATLATREDIVVAKLDSTENQIPNIKIDGYPTVYLFKKTPEGRTKVEFQGGRSVEEFIKFLDQEIPAPQKESSFPSSSATEITKANFDSLVWSNTERDSLIWFYSPTCDHCKALNSVYEQVYNKFKDRLQITRTDGTKNEYAQFLIESYPSLYLVKKNKEIIKHVHKDKSFEKISEFIDEYLGPAPTSTHVKGEVFQLTAANFNDVVINSPQTVFVKFFAPWCGHCKNMAEAYKQLAAKFGDRDDVIIAEMDWTVHKTTQVDVKGFPTLILFTKNPNEQKKYQSARTADEMAKFIEQNLQRKEDL